MPAPIAGTAAFIAVIFFGLQLRTCGVAAALLALILAASIPAHSLLTPDSWAGGMRHLPEGEVLELEGRLRRETELYADREHLYLAVDRAAIANRPAQSVHGTVRITVLEPAEFKLGERIRVAAKLRFPRNYGDAGEFDYEGLMAREGIAASAVVKHSADVTVLKEEQSFPSSAIESIRAHIGHFIDSRLHDPERAEMRALVIGDRGSIDRATRENFALTGMAHMLVISGLHLSFVASAAFGLARLLCALWPLLLIRGWANKIAAASAASAVMFYAAIAGHHVSTIRALIMVLSYVLAILLDRSREVLAALALAAIVICVTIPGSSADIGFQLSFASVLTIILGMRLFARGWKRFESYHLLTARRSWPLWRALGVAAGYVAVSLWALLGTAPLTALYFNQFSVIGLVANAIVVPVMGGAGVIGGLLAAALSFVSPLVAGWLLDLAALCLTFGTAVAAHLVNWPGAWVRTFTPTALEVSLSYGLLGLWLISATTEPNQLPGGVGTGALMFHPEAQRFAGRFSLRLAITAVIAGVALVDTGWWVYQRFFNPELRVTFLSVGQGDGAVVQFPGSRVMLIDGGGSFGDEFDPGERIVAPFLWSRKIMKVDYLALSHPELDHFGGFNFVARNFHPREFWTIDATSPDIKYAELLTVLAAEQVRLRLVDSSTPPARIGGTTVRVLNPEPHETETRNNSSMVLALEFRGTRILFTGDLEAKGERIMIGHGANLRATVLKVPHHGSATSSSAAFLEAVSPRYAVASMGYHNRYHFPAAKVVERYDKAGVELLRTDACGAVTVEAGRAGVQVRTWRNCHSSGALFK